jgi:toxin-antitoxin system PIN domain toxin
LVSLYDANLWVALAFAAHPHHAIASRHFKARDSAQPTAFCRVTQQAFLRLVSTPLIQRTYSSQPITNATAWSKCQDLLALPQILWLDEPVAFEDFWHRLAAIPSASPKVWMDAYLAAFAICHKVEFVTLDSDFKTFEKDGLKLKLLTQ